MSNANTFGSAVIGGGQQQQQERKRARARERVARAVRRGVDPHTRFEESDLAWAFRGHEEELAELEAQVEDAIAARTEKHRQKAERDDLREVTEQVLREWDDRERRERREKAEAEARKRLEL